MRQSADVGLTEDTERELDSAPARERDVESPSTADTESGTDPVLELLICWEEAYGRGEDLDPLTLCGDDPRWVGALRERIAKRKRLHALMALPQQLESDQPDAPLPDFPGHEVLERIGRGGMGIVYRARDVRLGRTVAIKTLAEARYAERDQVERFLDEARAVARLRHPNIVGIHAIGEHDGGTYLSLEYLEGGNLASRLAAGPMAPRPAAQLVAILAAAVDFAHRAGVVHRDLKPSNVLLTGDGVPKVGDFGLAKLLDSDSARTFSGQVMGTPSYMAPEQAEGHSGRVGPAADVYALGAILYHALAARPPFLGESALETIRLVTGTEAVPPTRLRPEIPRDLETVCLKCLEKEPARRYASAAELADDLDRFLDYRPIHARRIRAAARLVRWTRRNRALTALAAIFLLGTPGFFMLWLSARAERDRADDERGKAVAALVDARRAREQAEAARGETDAALKRADEARARAIRAIRNILLTEGDALAVEEARPYRQALTTLGLQEAEELVRTLGNDPRSEMQLISGYMALARLQRDANQAAAAESGRRSLAMAEAFDARNHSAESRSLLATVLHRSVLLARNPAEMRSFAGRSNAIFEALDAASSGPRADDAHSIALNYYNIGHSWFEERHLDQAAASLRSSIRVCEDAIRRVGADRILRLDLARGLVYLERVLNNDGRLGEAIEPGRRAIETYRALFRETPADLELANLLYLAEEELSFVYMGLNRWDDVIACHRGAREALDESARRHRGVVSRSAQIQSMIAIVDYNLAEAYAIDPSRNRHEYRATLAEALAICDKLELVLPLSPDLQIVQSFALLREAGFRDEDGLPPDPALLERAGRICEEILAKQPGRSEVRATLAFLRLERADELEALGRAAEARAVRRAAPAAAGRHADGNLLFQTAIVASDAARVAVARPARRARLTRRALDILRLAVDAGFRNWARLRTSNELAILRDNPEFLAMTAELADRAFPADGFTGRP